MSVVCVYTGIFKFQATSSLALQAQLASKKPPILFLYCVWTCILYSSGLLPWLSFSTHQHRLLDGHLWPESCGNLGVFIIQRPCSLCCFSKGGAKVCVWGEGDAGLTQCHWQLQNTTVDFPPIICSSPGRHRRDHTGIVLCVFLCALECVSSLGIWTVCVCFCVALWCTPWSLHELAHILLRVSYRAVCMFMCVSSGRWRAKMIAGWLDGVDCVCSKAFTLLSYGGLLLLALTG